jgi:hypothetical protein
VAHSLWRQGRETIAFFAVDLHRLASLVTAAAQLRYAALARGLGDLDIGEESAVFEQGARLVARWSAGTVRRRSERNRALPQCAPGP